MGCTLQYYNSVNLGYAGAWYWSGYVGWSEHASLLPYFGETAIYNAINFNFSVDQGPTRNSAAGGGLGGATLCFLIQSTASTAAIKEFWCPSDPQAGNGPYGNVGRNTNNYMASLGTSTYLSNTNFYTTSFASFPTTGLFGYQNCKSIAAVLDGTSNTVAFAEGVIDPSYPPVLNQRFNGMTGVTGLNSVPGLIAYDASSVPASVLAGIQVCNQVWQTGSGGAFGYQRGDYWCAGSGAHTKMTTLVVPNSTTALWGYCDNVGASSEVVFANADSYHPAGVNTLMADGSVKCIKNTINSFIWWALGTVANGEVISADQY
jgi:prepilin-type processing-associated H-X9-DG protein